MEKAGSPHTRYVGNVVDKSAADAALPEVRLDEQGIQLGTAVWARHYGSKAGDDAVALCDEHAALFNLLTRQGDRIRVGEKRVAVARIAE